MYTLIKELTVYDMLILMLLKEMISHNKCISPVEKLSFLHHIH